MSSVLSAIFVGTVRTGNRIMCCPLDCRPNLQPDDWMPCIECMDPEELLRYRKATGDYRKSGGTVKGKDPGYILLKKEGELHE